MTTLHPSPPSPAPAPQEDRLGGAVRIAFGVIFLWASGVHVGIVSGDPGLYHDVADGAEPDHPQSPGVVVLTLVEAGPRRLQREVANGDQQPQNPQNVAQLAEAEPEKEGQMSEKQAELLLKSMKDEEQRVLLDERKVRRHVYNDW